MFSYNYTRNCTSLPRGNEFLTRFEGRYCGTIAEIHFHGKFLLQRLFRCSGERNDAIPSGRGGKYVRLYRTALCPREYRASSFLSSLEAKLSPPWYLFNTDATPRQPCFFPIDQHLPKGCSTLTLPTFELEKYEIIIFNRSLFIARLLSLVFASTRILLVHHIFTRCYSSYRGKNMIRKRSCLRKLVDEIKKRRNCCNIGAESLERSSRENYRGCE